MRKIITSIVLFTILQANAQIGGGWDWAITTGSLGGANIKYMKYTADGKDILFGGDAVASVYFGSTTIIAPKISTSPGQIRFLGKINSSTGTATILKSFISIQFTIHCITTDDAGNFFIGATKTGDTDIDFGNGVIASGMSSNAIIAKFDAAGNAVWSKTFAMGKEGIISNEVSKLAVSSKGNIYFLGRNNNRVNSKVNTPLYKLDSNGNTLWYKDAFNEYGLKAEKGISTDKFIDNEENVHLLGMQVGGIDFDGVRYPGTTKVYGESTIISLDASGIITKAQTYDGFFYDYQVNRTTGNITFGWAENTTNAAPFNNLPHVMASYGATYAKRFSGMIETDKNFNFIRAKDNSTTLDNPFGFQNNGLKFLALPNGKLVYISPFGKKGEYIVGEYFYPADANKDASAIVETDNNWNITKFITGGKSATSSPEYITAYNDTYAMTATFFAENISPLPLPTTSYGSVNLTGFNASPELTTDYGIYSSSFTMRKDIAIVQTKSSNFPTITTNTLLLNSTDLKLYPNPATTNLYLKLPNTLENGRLRIISLTGQTVLEQQNLKAVDFNIDVNNLRPGFYIIECADGNLKFTKKFLKI